MEYRIWVKNQLSFYANKLSCRKHVMTKPRLTGPLEEILHKVGQ